MGVVCGAFAFSGGVVRCPSSAQCQCALWGGVSELSAAHGVGVAVAVVLIGWGSFRLLTRSMTSSTVVWADYVLVVVVAVTILSTTEGIDVVSSNSLPLAVSGVRC